MLIIEALENNGLNFINAEDNQQLCNFSCYCDKSLVSMQQYLLIEHTGLKSAYITTILFLKMVKQSIKKHKRSC